MPLSSALQRHSAFTFLKLAVILRRRFAEAVARTDSTLEQVAVMSCLWECGPMFHGQLANRIGMDVGNLVSISTALVGRMLIEMGHDERNRRRTELHISHAGRELVSQVWEEVSRLEEEFLQPLALEERKIWRGFAVRLLAAHC